MVPHADRYEAEAMARADALINAMYLTDRFTAAGSAARSRAVEAEQAELDRLVASLRSLDAPRGVEVVAHVMRHRPLSRKLSGTGVAGLPAANRSI